jgi:hypothetical protein
MDISGESTIIFASGTLHWCFIVGVSQSSRTGTWLDKTTQSAEGKWHLSRFSMFWIIK